MTKILQQILVYGKYGHTRAKSATTESSCSPLVGLQCTALRWDSKDAGFQTFGEKKLVRCSSKAVQNPEPLLTPQPPQSSPVTHPHGEKSSVYLTPATPACSDGFGGKAVCKLCVLVHLHLLCPQIPSLPCSAPGRAVVPNNHITWAASCSMLCCDQSVRTTQEPAVGEKLGCFFSVHPRAGPALMTM